ncbi:hypothetical protein [Nostoc sp. UHCC 0252]|uniref:hypothetical protein n=1 Tax=Nostoc sp. UHCC 0252 TaxID=3110241 RepID=UPI002B1F6305|nr:hypothetical protein [Nostoc sp. UHCC 0252]MEA5602727.1 hypothetical protein [Nostoc sp. UHCC 0252]
MCFANKSGFSAIALHIIPLPSHYEAMLQRSRRRATHLGFAMIAVLSVRLARSH